MTVAVREDLKIGGHYTARENEDGTFDILNVPIFTEVPVGAKRNKKHIGKEWQDAALLKNKAREAEGHLPPIHVYHSDEETVKPIYAGKLRLQRVVLARYQGATQWTTFGDILGMPGDLFRSKVQPGFMPYRSVEIHDWDKPEIDSMALMDTDVPFFRMPMLTIGKVVKRDAEYFLDSKSAAYACLISKAPSMAVLFKFGDAKPPKKKVDEAKPQQNQQGQETKQTPLPEEESGQEDNPEVEDIEEAGAPGEEGDEEEVTESAGHEAGESAALQALLAGQQALQALLTKLLQRMGPQDQPEEKLEAVQGLDLQKEAMQPTQLKDKEDEPMAEVKDPKAPIVESKVVTMKAEDLEAIVMRATQKAVLDATTPLKVEIEKLQLESTQRKEAGAVEGRFSLAMVELTKAKRHVSEEMQNQLRECAAHGDEFMKKQVAALCKSLPEEAPIDGAEFETEAVETAVGGGEGEAVEKFSASDPRRADWAKKQLVAFRAYRENNPGTDITAEEWLEVNSRSENMHVVNRV